MGVYHLMGAITTLGTNFDLGFQSDISRDELSPRAAFRMYDYIPQLESPLRKRGGWGYATPDLSGLGGHPVSIGWAPFPSDGLLLTVTASGQVTLNRTLDGSGSAFATADSGDTSILPTCPLFWHTTPTKRSMIILPGFNEPYAKVPKRFHDDAGTASYAVAPIPGTPPMARMGFSWGNYLVLGNYYDPTDGGKLHNNRWAFSAPDDITSWSLVDPNASRLDFPEEIVAGIPVLNSIIALGYENAWIVTGDIPPPGGNLARKILFAGVGTFDMRSVVGWRNYAIWANNSGVWMSDGATLTNLAEAGGISLYYRQLVENKSFVTGLTASAGIYRDHYVLSLKGALRDTTLVCDIQRKVWSEWTNVPSVSFAHRSSGPGTGPGTRGGDEELFFAHASLPRVGALSTLWQPGLTYAADADNSAVLPVLETPYYRLNVLSLKRIRFAYLGYDLTPAAGGAQLNCGFVLDPAPGEAYTAMQPLPTTAKYVRKRLRIGRQALGFGLRLAQAGASADTRLYSIESEGDARGPEQINAH